VGQIRHTIVEMNASHLIKVDRRLIGSVPVLGGGSQRSISRMEASLQTEATLVGNLSVLL